MKGAEKAIKGSKLSMSEKQSLNGDEIVVEVESEESNEAKRTCSKGSESSAPKQISQVELQESGPGFPPSDISWLNPTNPPMIPALNETLTRRKSLQRLAYSKPKSRFGELPYHAYLDMLLEDTSSLDEQVGASFHGNSGSFTRTVSSSSSKSPEMLSPERPKNKDKKLYKKAKLLSPERLKYKDKELYKKAKLNRDKQWKAFNKKILIKPTVFLCILVCLVASFTYEKLKNLMVWGLGIWKWCVLVMVMYCGVFIANWFMRFLIFMIETKFLLRKQKVLYCIQGMEESARVFIWLGLVLLTWLLLFNHGVEIERSKTCTRILHYVLWTLVSVLVGAFLWLLKTLLLKFLAFDFQSYTFFDRIQESIFHQYVLQTLSGNPLPDKARSQTLNFMTTHRNNIAESEKQAIDMGDLQKMKQKKVSPWTMKVLVDAVSTSGLSTMSHTFNDWKDAADEGKYKKITSEIEAATAAYHIFRNVAEPSKYIHESDLLKFMTKEEVKLVWPLIDVAKTGQIGKNDLTDYVVKAYKDREALAYALQDTKTAEKQFDRLVTGILIVITVIVWLLLLEIANTKVLVLLSSQIVLAAFMFGNTCKNIFEAIVFVFVIHPFDVGDRCVVDDVPLIVEEMNIFTTVFLKSNNEKVYYPNSVLSTKTISNYYRSSDMKDTVEFSIALTPVEKIVKLKERIKEYLERNPQYWHPKHNVAVIDFEDVNKLKMAVYFHHTMNFQEFEEKNVRRAELVFELLKILEELNITYSMPPQEVHLKTKSEAIAA
ncbi:mechanosensitive ion channel protein 10-like [Rosa rugosa]|uniref:mechanosensitive ion channel protein 10-like n=1 Tax=Rosa rugosa TaxID=74645 RepID=UPI002B408805|nr:mechanosensitive ion channel protein 10-like [Rosa rugosa]